MHKTKICIGKTLIVIFLCLCFSKNSCSESWISKPWEKPALFFSVSQGFLNGPVESVNKSILERQIQSLRKFASRYEVFVILHVWESNVDKYVELMEYISKNELNFVIEAYSSDVLTNARSLDVADVSHGLPLTGATIKRLKGLFPTRFLGLRVFETFMMNFTVDACSRGAPWCKPFADKTARPFFSKSLLAELVQLAHENELFVLFSDPYWSFDHVFQSASIDQVDNEFFLQELSKQYPNTLLFMYNNNEPDGASVQQLHKWYQPILSLARGDPSRIGLSVQAWECGNIKGNSPEMECPIAYMLAWVNAARAQGVRALEFEPYWYFWDIDKGDSSRNFNRGTGSPRLPLNCLARTLETASLSDEHVTCH